MAGKRSKWFERSIKNNGKSLLKWQNNIKKGAENSLLKMAFKDYQKMAGKDFPNWQGKCLKRGREGVVKMNERRRSGVDS